MRLSMTSDLWWKTAFVYCLDVQTFHDGDGDGMGDFRGLSAKVDHLAELGVTVLWLMPFYPTADRDDGYDITDFYAVDPRLGTLGDMVEFLRIARDRGIRVIADLVINHTSAEHPWFTDARSSRTSRYRDWYLWRDDEPTGPTQPVVFPGEQQRVWTHTPETGAWYHHDFYRHQPTLNVANPQVRDEITRIMGFWMELGLAGFRVDAVPFLLQTVDEADRPVDAAVDEPHELLQALRGFLVRRRGDAILLGEVNLPHNKAATFFGSASGDQLSMLFDFTTMQSLYLAMARRDATVLRRTLHDRPIEPSTCQWAMFLRNHDELTLDQLDDHERSEVFAAFGPQEHMQLFGRGLRRRLPPMLDGDGDRLRMAYSLLFSLPGTPSVFYGEEIGMGENLDIDGRMAVRTPMQWDDGPNAGFSTVDDPSRLVRPLVRGEYDAQNGVTVAAQRDDPASLLSWVTLLARRYRDCPELAWGTVDVLDVEPAAVLALRARWEGGTVLAVHNLSATDVDVDLGSDDNPGTRTISDLLGTDGRYDVTDRVLSLHLSRYDTRWYRIGGR
jgi:trehalose synthase